jgi:hypothetical protein
MATKAFDNESSSRINFIKNRLTLGISATVSGLNFKKVAGLPEVEVNNEKPKK